MNLIAVPAGGAGVRVSFAVALSYVQYGGAVSPIGSFTSGPVLPGGFAVTYPRVPATQYPSGNDAVVPSPVNVSVTSWSPSPASKRIRVAYAVIDGATVTSPSVFRSPSTTSNGAAVVAGAYI